jgi:hypothetical protein
MDGSVEQSHLFKTENDAIIMSQLMSIFASFSKEKGEVVRALNYVIKHLAMKAYEQVEAQLHNS